MKLAILETSFAAHTLGPMVRELRKNVRVDCLVVEAALQRHFEWYGLTPTFVDSESRGREVDGLSEAALYSRLKDLRERWGLPTLRQLMISDQAYRSKTVYGAYDAAREGRRMLRLSLAIGDYLDRERPDFVLQNIGAEMERRVTRCACDERGIPTVFFDYIPFFKGYQPGKNEFSDLHDVPLREVGRDEVKAYFDSYFEGRSIYYAGVIRSGDGRGRLRRFIEEPDRWSLLVGQVSSRGFAAYRSSRRWIMDRLLTMAPKPPAHRRLLLFPMQSVEESTVTVRSFGFSDQMQLVRQISLALPDDCSLLVKFHPHYFGVIDLREVRALMQLPDVYLMQSGVPMRQLLDQVDGVITINSTVGFEGVIMGKPVALLGKAIYGGQGLVVDACTPRDWPRAFSSLLDFRPGRADTEALVARWLARGFRGLFYDGAETLSEDILQFCARFGNRSGTSS